MTDQLAGEEDASVDVPPANPKRVSKWDRPPEPHDWRFFVGWVGKILITTGLLMFGFVAYQLWGTGIETARAQNKLENQFEELVVSTSSATTATTPAPATTAPPPVSTVTAGTDPLESTPASAAPTLPGTTVPAAVDQSIPPIERGQVLAKLEIPKIGKVDGSALYVVPGVSVEDLKKGPGHYPDTPLPGQLGNASIAGHRTTFGEPFRHIDELEPGDEILVTMVTGERFVYEVTSTEIVGPDDYYVVTTTDPTVAELTLTSCHPVYTARQRIAVHALLRPEESAPVGQPTYYDLEANVPDDGATADDPAVRPDATSETDTTETAQVDDASSASSATDGATVAPSADQPAEVQDAFADGWFHDSGAWLQIALWGGALVLIAIAVRMISRRFRHDSIGIAVGIIPFLICLYFFYQNVNRLLPPGF